MPSDESGFFYARDLGTVARLIGPILRVQIAGPGAGPLLNMPDVDALAEALEHLDTRMAEAGIDLEHPIATWSTEGESMIIFGGERPVNPMSALPSAPSGEDECAMVDGEVRLVACVNRGQTLSMPRRTAGRSAHIHRKLQDALPTIDLSDASAMGRATASGAEVRYAIRKHGNELSVHVDHPALARLDGVLEPGRPRTLGLAAPGVGIAWARARKRFLEQLESSVAGESTGALEGEFMLVALPARQGVVALASRSAGPVPAWFDRAVEAISGAPWVTVTSVEVQPKTRTLHVAVDEPGSAGLLHATTLRPRATLFSTPRWVGVAGSIEPQLAEQTIVGLDRDRAGAGDTLPAELVSDLGPERVLAFAHLPLDGLSTPEFAEDAGAFMDAILEGSGARLSVPPRQMTQVILGFFAPISSVTVWIVRHERSTVLRAVIRTLGDVETDEGKEALAAALAFVAGGNPADVLEPLVEKYPASASHFSYRVRAGLEDDAASMVMTISSLFRMLDSLPELQRSATASASP